MRRAKPLKVILRRDRMVVMAGILGLVALAWAYIVYVALTMENTMTSMGTGVFMPQTSPWGAIEFVLMFVMWTVMMVAMMVPTAAPMILVFATVSRRRQEQQRPFVPTGMFLAGYVVIWSGFSLLATLGNWGLHMGGLLSSMMGRATPVVGGLLLIAAGIFQWSRLKYVCLAHCRSPIGFLMSEWQEGAKGALSMGLRHGMFCLGCCWLLMTLLFVLGVMNLLWIAALAVFVLIEKVAPAGHWVGRFTGLLLVLWGAWIIVGVFA